MANLSDDIQCAGSDHDHYQEATCAHHEDHMMHDCVQLDHVVDSHADYTSDSNIILYDQYVKDNEVPVIHTDVSSVPTDAFMMIYDDMCEPHDQSVSYPSWNTAVQISLTAELATYKEHIELYEQRAKFELTEREQKINEQLSRVISDRNFKEETLKRELHSIKLQLTSTINHNKSMVEEVSFLKRDFKQKENKFFEDFLDIKSLKEKVEDKLIKQDQSLQTVHMLCRPRPNPNELNRVAISYKNPLYLTHAKQVQPALYNGHQIIKDNHKPTIVHDTEDTLEIAEITRKKMNDKINDPECVTRKLKSKALKEQTMVSRPIKAFTVYPPNTPATLVPKVLPMKSQVKIHIFTLIQLFFEFDKTCKKRITPTGFTDGERGFKQTKACYLQEVIPFFKTLKYNFKGNQKALTKEVKEMKDVFEELEAEVAQFAVDRKRDTTDSQITKLTNQVTHLQAQNDLFRAENDKIKQHYKELYDSIKITRTKHIEQVTKLTTENVNLKTSVSKATVNPQVSARDKHAIDVEPIVPRLRNNRDVHLDYLRHLKESVEIIHDIVEEAKVVRPRDRSIVSACRYTKHSQELLEYAIGTCPQGSQQRVKQLAYIPLIRKKQVTVAKPSDKSDVVTSRDVLTAGSTLRIPLLYRGEYSQWVERFMNYLEEQTDGEAMINSIKNGLPNDIYSLIDSNKTVKDLWDAFARHMLGSEYGEQYRKAAVLYEYETFKATEGELLLDTYIRYLQVINDLKKCGYSKNNYELNFKFLNNLRL
nr:hypothetical protein [Tanacetum cinerariifolium]